MNGQEALGQNKAAASNSFKEEEKYFGSFSGKVPLHRVLKKFLDAFNNQGIMRSDQVSLLLFVLSGLALDFYNKSIRGVCTSTDETFEALESRFNSL